MSRPTVSDIGRAAGVSLATVDRVLNGRPGVRQSTIDRVHATIRELGYVRDVAAANLARGRRYRFAFLLPARGGAFVRSIRDAVAAAARTPVAERSELTVIDVPPGDPHRLVRTLRDLDRETTDGIAILADETPQLRDEIVRLRERGVRVVAIVSDLPSTARDHYVGIEQVAAGRTAGFLMGRFVGRRPGAVVTLAGSMLSRQAVERRLGFDRVLGERFPLIEALPTVEVHDSADVARDALARVLDRRRDVVGVYMLGAGHRGALEVLRGRDDVIAVGHDLTAHLAEALRAGTVDAVITQNVDHIVRSAVRVLRAKTDGQAIVESQERVRIEIVVGENLPGDVDRKTDETPL